MRRFIRDGRALAAYTRVDQLYQAYLVAFLTMSTLGVKANPTSPYATYETKRRSAPWAGPTSPQPWALSRARRSMPSGIKSGLCTSGTVRNRAERSSIC